MPLEPIANPERQSSSRIATRVAAWSVATALLLGALTACAEGTSRDAEVGKQRDAERTSVVTGLQATNSAALLGGTPTTTPPAES